MSDGGKGGDVVVGYQYYLDVQLGICRGPVDSVNRFIIGERVAWSGSITSDNSVYVNAPELFGGESREGGVQGTMTVSMGTSTTQDSRLVALLGNHVPAFLNRLTVIFKNFMWSSGNPYFKAPWFDITRVYAGWNNGIWYSAKAKIGSYDMNPAHIIYQCLTDPEWGMGYTINDLDDTAFKAAADQLYSENFGLSLMWGEQMTIQDFVQIICNHINATIDLDLTTGLFRLKLIRDGYDVNTLVELNISNSKIESFQRAAWGETVNEITVKYTDRDQNEQTVTVQDLAAIDAQGGTVINSTKEYLGIRDPSLAMRVAMRDLATSASPLAKVTIVTNRVMWDKTVGDLFALTWTPLGISKAPFRIVGIDKGELADSRIRIEAIEDIFGLPSSTYSATAPSGWVDTAQPPSPAASQVSVEAPYWDIVRTMSAADFATLTSGYAFGQMIATAPGGLDFGYELWSSTTGVGYTYTNKGHFTPTGVLAADMGYPSAATETINMTNVKGLFAVVAGSYAIIGNEYVSVVSIDTINGIAVIARGVLDTVPKPHAAGTIVYFAGGGNYAYDSVQHAMGMTMHYKALTKTALGTLSISSATDAPVTFTGRADLPYPPGNLQFSGASYPDHFSGAISLTWSHRDRTAQTVALVPYNVGNIGPESGVGYTLTISGESSTLFSGNIAITSYSMSLATELASSTLTSYGTDRVLVGLGLAKVTSSLSTALGSLHQFAQVNGGDWLGARFDLFTSGSEEAKHVTSAAVVTTRSFAAGWNSNAPLFSLKSGIYNSTVYPDYYVGWGVSKDTMGGTDPSSRISEYDWVDGPIVDRRSSPNHVFFNCITENILVYFPQSRSSSRRIYATSFGLRLIKTSDVLTGPLPVTRSTVDNFYIGNATQFNDFTNSYLAQPSYTGWFTPQFADGQIRKACRGIIFGNLLYYNYLGGGGSPVNTSGKTIDMTNILTAHIDVYPNWTDKTKVFIVDALGNLTPVSTRSGVILADQIDSSVGVEIVGSTLYTVNMTTGAQIAPIATITGTAMAICGDVPNGHVYILCSNSYLYKYDSSGTLLGSVGPLPGVSNGVPINVTSTRVYVNNTIQVDKGMGGYSAPFSGINAIYTSSAGSSVMLANYQSSPTGSFSKTLVDDAGIGSVVLNGPTPRVNDTIRVQLGSVRGSSNSYTSHDITIKRGGYGLRYGEFYGG